MVASNVVMIICALASFVLCGRLSSLPTIRRLRRELSATAYRADHDVLTGLPNRCRAEHIAHNMLAANRSVMVALVDLNLFKQVNDTHGHAVGDRLLTVVAQRLSVAADEAGGAAARLGGDEFVLILPVGTSDDLETVARILTRLEQPADLGGTLWLTPRASAGVAFSGPDATTWPMLLQQADLALYEAKAARTRYAVNRTISVASAKIHRNGWRIRNHQGGLKTGPLWAGGLQGEFE